jgi:hypothetical protein
MAQWAQGRGVPVPSLIFKRKQLLHRLEVLLDNAVNHSLRMNRRFAAASVVAIVLAAAIVLRVQVPVIAKAIELPPHLPKVAPLRVAVKRVHVPLRVLQVPVPQKRQTVVRPAIKPVKAIAVHKAAIVAPKIARSIARRAAVRTAVAVASVAPVAPYVATVTAAAYAPAVAQVAPRAHSNDILDALDAAGIHNLSVDQLLAIRDHGVSTTLIRAAVAYFGSRISPDDLVTLADHGVSASYLDALRAEHVGGIPPASVVMLMDHGVNASLIREANAYFTSASAADLVYLSDHGVGAQYLESMRVAGVRGVGVGDLVRLMDHGVDARYVIKVRRFNPRASLDDIIRLHDAGF